MMNMKKKIFTVMAVCLLLTTKIYAKIDIVQPESKIVTEPVITIDSINDGLGDANFNIDSSKWEGTRCKYELIQELPIQFVTDDKVVYTIRLKDIISYKCKPGNTKMIVTIKGSEYRTYGYINRTIDDPRIIKLIIHLFEMQKELILTQF